jgi:predicted NAD/FAD-binding protein
MKIAIIGAGISGLAAAERLHAGHDIAVFEAAETVGGHSHTVRVETADGPQDVDTGFVVFNEATYPEFCRLLSRLGVASQPTRMGFGVVDDRTGIEYAGESLAGVFAQKRNLFRPDFLRMLADVMRFNRTALTLAERLPENATLSLLCEAGRFSPAFRDLYLVPMGAAIWSTDEQRMLEFPARLFIRFFKNHGLLEPPARQLAWRVITGGSRRYVDALVRPFSDRLRVATPVHRVARSEGGVLVSGPGYEERFDEVVLAVHADTALRILADATPRERELLGAFPYQRNDAVLHTDTRVLPRRRRAWASWNYRVPAERGRPVSMTYDMSRLQGLRTREPLLVSLNAEAIVDPSTVLRRVQFEHPVLTLASVAAQARHAEISGTDRVHFCGAYWRNGFHEDGVVSGLAVANAIARGRG